MPVDYEMINLCSIQVVAIINLKTNIMEDQNFITVGKRTTKIESQLLLCVGTSLREMVGVVFLPVVAFFENHATSMSTTRLSMMYSRRSGVFLPM